MCSSDAGPGRTCSTDEGPPRGPQQPYAVVVVGNALVERPYCVGTCPDRVPSIGCPAPNGPWGASDDHRRCCFLV